MSNLTYDKDGFYLDGEKIKIVSGAIHYFRVVPEYWRDRLLKLKESGCNCVETYVCWNLHEKREGKLDFSGALDLGAFLDIAKELGLWAIVRPGPYICSEWEFGGLPWWLLKYPDVELRCYNERFLSLMTPYLDAVCDVVRPRLITDGGNVIFMQIENEYGSYGNDREYLLWYKKFYEDRGIDCPYITSDGPGEMLFRNGCVDGVLASANYRSDSKWAIGNLKAFRDNQPGAVLELWNGMGMRWQTKFERRDVEEVKQSVRQALEYCELINLYMFHGGTTFGFMNGAFDTGSGYMVQRSSYDVDAPLDEYGRRTPKFYAEQEVICKALGKPVVNTASDTVIKEYNAVKTGECTLSECGLTLEKIASPTVKPMEHYNMGYGYIIYSAAVFADTDGADLIFPDVHDVAQVWVDGEFAKTLYRWEDDRRISISAGEHKVEILVENLGRVNYGRYLKDYKGLVGDVVLFDKLYNVYTIPMGWQVYSLSLDTLPEKISGKAEINKPAFYKYEFEAEEVCDTVVHFDGFTRGAAFINGFNLGRHWNIETAEGENKLFVPAPLIKEGKNEIVVFDVFHTNEEKNIRLGE